MNKRKLFSGFCAYPQSAVPAFAVCAVFFTVGCFAGVFSGKSAAGVVEYVDRYLGGIASGAVSFSFGGLFWDMVKFHILAFLFGFSMLGVAALPALSALRGFTLAFSIASFTRAMGFDGAVSAYLLFGLGAFISVPCFFALAVQSLCASSDLIRAVLRNGGAVRVDTYNKAYFLRFIAVILLMVLPALGECYILSSHFIDSFL